MITRHYSNVVLTWLACVPIAWAQDSKPIVPLSIRGLDPALYHRYEPSTTGNFTCLDSSLTIPFSAVNDDYCDCPDGSDEPGTSACGNSWFYCQNEGHLPGRVLGNRVNDGICDPECCDGSDEWQTGACSDQCAKIGRDYREKYDSEMKTRKTGSKIRSTYIKWAVGERKRLEEELAQKSEQVKAKEAEVEQTKLSLDKSEARSREELEKRKQSPLYMSLLTHRLALTRMRSRTSRLQQDLDSLHNILDELTKGYNPNYQDMAVKAAVVGYEEVLRGPAPLEGQAQEPAAEQEEEIQDKELDELDKKDLEALLLQDMGEEPEEEGTDGLLYRIDEYIPDVLYGSWESIRDMGIDWLIRVGVLGKSSKGASKATADSPHVTAARDKHNAAQTDFDVLKREISSAQRTLEKMTDGFGPQAEWKKLDGTCIDKVSGDYTYEVCFFGRATQKSNKDSSSNFLGTFTHWNDNAPAGSFERYTRQHYQNGAKCWNGPMRSATVDISCGRENTLLSISEPEKCEYSFKVTSPALCWPLDEAGASQGSIAVKAEL